MMETKRCRQCGYAFEYIWQVYWEPEMCERCQEELLFNLGGQVLWLYRGGPVQLTAFDLSASAYNSLRDYFDRDDDGQLSSIVLSYIIHWAIVGDADKNNLLLNVWQFGRKALRELHDRVMDRVSDGSLTKVQSRGALVSVLPMSTGEYCDQ